MGIKTWASVSLIAILVLATAAAWRARGREIGVKTSNAFTITRDLVSPLVGGPAPEFRVPLVSGEELDLSSLRGRLVLISFWSSF